MNKKSILVLAGVFLITTAAIFAFKILSFKKSAEISAADLYENFEKAADQLFNFELDEAKQSFQDSNSEILTLRDRAGDLGLLNFSKIRDAFTDLLNFVQISIDLSNNLSVLKNNAFSWIVNGQGTEIIKLLETARSNIGSLSETANKLDQLDTSADLRISERFLDAFIDWLRLAEEQHFLIAFQNPSEIRPAGGFLGSFADLTLKRASLLDIDVQDIYNPDGQLDLKIIPPQPLQLITIRWGARDANWFFDFPTSAKKVIQLLENSKFYQERNIKFAGVLAININVIRDLLDIIGPIELPDYQLVINADNFLTELQKEVEMGQDKTAGEPKRILKVLTPILFEKIGALDEGQKKTLAKNLKNRLNQKDIQVYFKDLAIEIYLQVLGIAGEIQKLPGDFWGNYLAVVNANIGGGKSDAFIAQKIKLDSVIKPDGSIASRLVVSRRHDGQDQKEWWYRKTNKNWFQIFLDPKSVTDFLNGDEAQEIKSLVDYEARGFETDPDLRAIESAPLIFGKKVISGWQTLKAGESKDLELKYNASHSVSLDSNPTYQFIFEKQSGVSSSLEFSVQAPEGYFWEASQSPFLVYSSPDPPARAKLTSGLIKK